MLPLPWADRGRTLGEPGKPTPGAASAQVTPADPAPRSYCWHDVGMVTTTLRIATGNTEAVIDITHQCAEVAAEADADGLLSIFVPHATAGIAILETGAGSDDDLLAALQDLLPADDRWKHRHGSAGHGRSHVMPALIPPYATVPVISGRLALGTWQSICLVDLNIDNPDRVVLLSLMTNAG